MNARNRQPLVRSCFALALLVGASACESGSKQIGALDAGGSEGDGDPGDGDGDPGDGDLDGETGEACTGGSSPDVCAEPEGVDIDFFVAPEVNEDARLDCAANVAPNSNGHIVTFTHCTGEQGEPLVDHELHLMGDWPALAFADGDEPLTELRLIRRNLDDSNYTALWVILRSKVDDHVMLVAFSGTELLLDPGELSPLELGLDNAGCAPDVDSCAGLTEGLQYRIGFLLRYGCSESVVTDDTSISDFGIEEGTGFAYEVLAGFASKHQCEPDGDFHELMLGIVEAGA